MRPYNWYLSSQQIHCHKIYFYLFIFTKEKTCTRTKAGYWVEHILLCKWGDVTNFFAYHSFIPKVTEFCLYILIIIRLRKQYGEVFKSMGSEARLPSFKSQQLPRAVTLFLVYLLWNWNGKRMFYGSSQLIIQVTICETLRTVLSQSKQ